MPITKSRPGIDVILFQGEDVEKLEQLLNDVRKAGVHAANVVSSARAGDTNPAIEASRAYDEFAEEATARGVVLRLLALRRADYRRLLKEHPPRADVRAPDVVDAEGRTTAGEVVESFPQDLQYGFNVDTLGPILVPASVAPGQFDADGTDEDYETLETLLDPDKHTERDAFIDELSDQEWSRVFSAAVRRNQDGGPDPKARLSSRLEEIFSEISRSPLDSD